MKTTVAAKLIRRVVELMEARQAESEGVVKEAYAIWQAAMGRIDRAEATLRAQPPTSFEATIRAAADFAAWSEVADRAKDGMLCSRAPDEALRSLVGLVKRHGLEHLTADMEALIRRGSRQPNAGPAAATT